MFVPLNNCDTTKWSDFTLICPCISVGNVGQLATDLLISTLKMQQVGYLYDSSMLPMCGNDPFSTSGLVEGKLCTSAEVYKCDEKKLLVVQLRALLVKGKHSQFRKKLLDWIQQSTFRQVILLTSSFAYERLDSQITGSPLRYLVTPLLKKMPNAPNTCNLQWTPLERREYVWSPEPDNASIPEEARGIYLPGGGIARKFFEECCKEDIPLAVLLIFCSEGDNIPHAVQLANYLNDWLKFTEKRTEPSGCTFKIPSSWTLLFGSAVNPELY
ncbi:proteasome assembly chaperone 2-like [Anneissia japonica]|uniref:proteasome assembly chaperone 2-like n=1 Tax=Anneissia japonica TaxID=1529436 RepID=UPI00142581B9|nr:proteasome assembly chaperone 2-like [Anneissia japonica]